MASSPEEQDSQKRSNPFDKELYMDERYYEPSIVDAVSGMPETIISRQTSPGSQGSSASGNNPPTNGKNNGGGVVHDWELGISPPGGSNRMGHTRVEELALAIDSCKEMIMQCEGNKEKRRKLVEKLVQLRFQLQELKDGPMELPTSEKSRVVTGHEFTLQERSGRNPYCERCQNVIWRLVQPWYRCKVCGYRSHEKCLDLVRRVCAGVQAKNSPVYVMKICPEKGLAAQKYRCVECKAKLAYGKSREQEPRLCDYSGQFYCSVCHWNDEMTIPARVVQNWDFEPKLVSRRSKQLLEILQKKPLMRLDRLNPALFNYVEELRLVRKIRQDIMLMKCYFICCKKAKKLRILWHLKKRQHFVEGPDAYSLQDLLDLQNGSLEHELRGVFDIFIQHIKRDCESCRGNGFLCELCPNKDVIFPFDDYISICKECQAVFHRRCFDKKGKECTRCDRRKSRQLSISQMPDLTPPETSDTSPERSPTKNSAPATTVGSEKSPEVATNEVSDRLSEIMWENGQKPEKNLVDKRAIFGNRGKDLGQDNGKKSKEMEGSPFQSDVKSGKNPFEEEEGYDESLNPFEADSKEGYDETLNPFE